MLICATYQHSYVQQCRNILNKSIILLKSCLLKKKKQVTLPLEFPLPCIVACFLSKISNTNRPHVARGIFLPCAQLAKLLNFCSLCLLCLVCLFTLFFIFFIAALNLNLHLPSFLVTACFSLTSTSPVCG